MAANREIIENVKQVRSATYGRDVREAIARALELCYGYTSGETAIEAAERANTAAAAVEAITSESQELLDELSVAVANADNIVKISETQPTEATNKLWIQPQDDTEFKVATYAAYEVLWNRMVEINNTYALGHGGIVNFEEDTTYVDETDDLQRRFVITYSDGETGEIFVRDGVPGPVGPTDTIVLIEPFYYRQSTEDFTSTPPTSGWSSTLPTLNAGDYLWTQSRITYESGVQAYLYGLSRMGLNGADGRNGIDGTGAVNSVAIGTNGTPLAGDIKLPVDSAPTENSGNLLTSGAVYTALQNAGSLESPAFTGTPTAPTPTSDDNSTRLATTEFVQNAVNMKSSSLKLATLSLNSTRVEYLDSDITENTVVLAVLGLDYVSIGSSLTWTTSSGSLVVTVASAPSSLISFDVVLAEAV